MDKPDQTALEAVRALGANVGPPPLEVDNPTLDEAWFLYDANGQPFAEVIAGYDAAVYTALAVNFYEPLVAALGGANQELRKRHVTLYSARIEECDERHRQACGVCVAAATASAVLTAIQKAAAEAL
jgi:hypothetical protein